MICVALSNAIRIRDDAGRPGKLKADFERPMHELRDDIDSIPELLLENPLGPSEQYIKSGDLKATFDGNFFPHQQFVFPDRPANRQHVMLQLIDLIMTLDPQKNVAEICQLYEGAVLLFLPDVKSGVTDPVPATDFTDLDVDDRLKAVMIVGHSDRQTAASPTLAGLGMLWQRYQDQQGYSQVFAIVTTTANDLVRDLFQVTR